MKKGIKVILILAVVFLLIGIALCVASVAMGANPLKLLSDGTYTLSVSDPIGHILDPDLYDENREGSFGQRPGNFGEAESTGDTYSVSGDIKNLEIDWVSGNVKIIRGEGENITFSESDSGGIDADDKLYYEVNGDTLKIECCRSGKVQIGININSGCGGKELVVNVPYALGDLTVDTTSADVDIDGLVIHGKMYVSTTSGVCSAVNMDSSDVVLDSTSGDLCFVGTCSDFSAESTSGRVVFTGFARELEADTTSGEVRFILNATPAELSAETVSGEVSMYLPPDASFELEFDSVSGSFNCEYPVSMRDGAYYAGTGGAEIDVDTTSGDLKVYHYK